MEPLLREFVIFFAFWPLVILATILLGVRMGRLVSRSATKEGSRPAVAGLDLVRSPRH